MVCGPTEIDPRFPSTLWDPRALREEMDTNLERYSRQMRFYGVGEAGQRKLLASHVTLCGCGALGTVLANALVRGGVGHLRLVDRDFIETNNLQRQVLFDEHDVAENLPKAEAAARKLSAINSSVHVEPVVADIDRTNILELSKDADILLDGTDNFEVRYLINDVAVKLDKPWVYGGSIGSHGQTMTILPGKTPCLRRRFEWLEGAQGSHTTSLCGRNAVQVAQRTPGQLNFEEMARHLETLGEVSYNRFLLRFSAEGHEFTVFPDGRAIIKGTSDVDKARTLYARYIGH